MKRNNSDSSIRNKKERKCRSSDGSLYNCTPIKLDEDIDSSNSSKEYEINEHDCSKYYKDHNLIHQNTITEIDVIEYLNLRIEKNEELDLVELESEEHCITIDTIDNSVKINNDLIKSNNITVSKYISTGCYGVIFVSSNDGGFIYVVKLIIYNKENKNEIKTMIDIKNRNNTKIPNFINISYYHLKCKQLQNNSRNNILKGINIALKNKQYTMLIVEYFDGEVYTILKPPVRSLKYELTDAKKCIYAQMLLSLYLFHNKFNYYHKDAHLKNFLYKKVTADNKYFHYRIKNTKSRSREYYNYYIKNEGFIIVLSDFGLSKPKKDIADINRELSRDDYYDILFDIQNYVDSNNKVQFENYFTIISRKQPYDELEFLNFMMNNILNIKNQPVSGDIIINTGKPYE
jgi:hypothetical protein